MAYEMRLSLFTILSWLNCLSNRSFSIYDSVLAHLSEQSVILARGNSEIPAKRNLEYNYDGPVNAVLDDFASCLTVGHSNDAGDLQTLGYARLSQGVIDLWI